MYGMKKPMTKPIKFPHDMFLGKVKKIAKNMAEHKMLERLGYTHTKPK